MSFSDDTILLSIVTITAAILGAFGTFLIMRSHQERASITILESIPTPLIEVKEDLSDAAKSKISISINGEPTDAIYVKKYYIKNTGNTTVEDIEFLFRININDRTNPTDFFKRAFVQRTDGNWISQKLIYSEDSDKMSQKMSFKCDYLNKGDEFSIFIITPEDSYESTMEFRKPGVERIMKIRPSSQIIDEVTSTSGIANVLLKAATLAPR